MMRAPNLPDVPVVIGDTDEYCRRILREMLRAARIRRILEVTSADSLKTRLDPLGFSLAFIDLELPELGAPDVVRAIASCQTSVIGMTRRVTPELARSAGMVCGGGLLLKPFTPSAVWTRMLLILNMAGMLNEVGREARGLPRSGWATPTLLGEGMVR